MKKLVKKWAISMLGAILLFAFGGTMEASAAEIAIDTEIPSETEALFVTGYTVTNETITPGSEFTLTLTIRNYSSLHRAEGAYVVVTNPGGVIPEYGTISEVLVEEIGRGEDVEVSFKYSAEATIASNYLDFGVSIVSESTSSSARLRIPVGRLTDFSAESVQVPRAYTVGQTDYVSAKVTNLGMTGLSNVVMVARCDGEEISSTRIGSMVAGTNKTETLSVSFAEEGSYVLDLLLTYTNDEGEEKEYMIASNAITVGAEEDTSIIPENIPDNDTEQETVDVQEGIASDTVILICICGFLLIAVCCVVLILIYRRK